MNTTDATRLVIVEDELAVASMYQFKLTQHGFNVRTAKNGKEGLELIKEFKPALILLDLRMPEMSGDEMLEHLRSMEGGTSIRVIILTNISKDEAPTSLRFYNVDRYIVKAHYTPSQVVSIVNEVLDT